MDCVFGLVRWAEDRGLTDRRWLELLACLRRVEPDRVVESQAIWPKFAARAEND